LIDRVGIGIFGRDGAARKEVADKRTLLGSQYTWGDILGYVICGGMVAKAKHAWGYLKGITCIGLWLPLVRELLQTGKFLVLRLLKGAHPQGTRMEQGVVMELGMVILVRVLVGLMMVGVGVGTVDDDGKTRRCWPKR
jgi:hypothetical protein